MPDPISDMTLVDPWRREANAVLAALGVEPAFGLSQGEADRRLRQWGPNALKAEAKIPVWKKVLAQFNNVLVMLLLVAAAVSAGLWFYERDSALPFEAMAIFAIVVLNAVMGYVQQARAEQAVAALQTMSAAKANVIRDGVRETIAAAEIAPGDIILVEEGDTAPADGRLIESTALQMAEAALTGESLPVDKDIAPIDGDAPLGDQRNMIFSGTAATYGRGRAVVTATGMRSQMGRIADLLKDASSETTPLQRELDRVGRLLGVVVLVIAGVMVATILLVEDVRGFSAIFDVLILGVALAVAAVPEGLPAIVTAVLSLGVQRMARRHAIVRHLAAVETLGSADVIASDKTGTLTRNEMTVRVVATASGQVTLTGTGYDPQGEARGQDGCAVEGDLLTELQRTLTAAERANNAVLQEEDGRWSVQGDPTEGALIVAARKACLETGALEARFCRIGEAPFSSERKLMSTVHTDEDRRDRLRVLTKGAPDVLLARCTHELVGRQARELTEARRKAILAANDALADEALRTLGVAFRSLPNPPSAPLAYNGDLEHDLVFLGLVGMIDPPRAEAKAAVARARVAGVRPIMITGDHPRTAAVIATELGISDDGRVIAGPELETLSDADLERAVKTVSVFARVDPEHKLRIVKALQRGGLTVAMTGDGVNDAPALRTADIGVAMGVTGTDVSKQAADVVLADDNFATIVAAVEEGRAIYANIRKFLRYLLSSNTGEVMTMFFGVVLADVLGLTQASGGGLILPLLATQILWINLVTDGAPALALGVDPARADAMREPPRPRGEKVVTSGMWGSILSVGAVMAAGTLLLLDGCLPGGLIEGAGSLAHAQTMAFTTLTLFSLFTVLNARSDTQSAFLGLFSNPWLWAALGLSLGLQILVVYTPVLQQAFSTTPLAFNDWLVCVSVASSVLWAGEAAKIAAALHRSGRRTESDFQAPGQAPGMSRS